MASYVVNERGVARARELIDARQYVLRSDWGDAQPRAEQENAYLERHGWDDYAGWFLALTEGAGEGTKARYAFAHGDSAGSTAWASSPASTAPPSGGTRRSSSQRTSSCSTSTASAAERGNGPCGRRRLRG